MSGAFGWGGKDRLNHTPDNNGFTRAVDAYSRPARAPSQPAPAGGSQSYVDPDYRSTVTPQVDLSPRREFKSTAENVLIVATDVTGSLSDWRQDIFKFLPMLYKETQQYLGDDLEILFIAYGDAEYGDRIEVATFGRGAVLDTHLSSLYKDAVGGGNMMESTDLVAYLIHERVDTSSAKHVYTFFITDEKCYPQVSSSRIRELDLPVKPEITDSRTLFRSLLRRMEVFVVFAETNAYPDEMGGFKADWTRMVGPERVCPMARSNLVVETMLGVVAKTTGQLQTYTQNYVARRGGTQYGGINKSHVDRSIALVPGAGPSAPNLAAKSRLLIASDDDK